MAAVGRAPWCTHDQMTRACNLAAARCDGEAATDASPELRRSAVSTRTDPQPPDSHDPSSSTGGGDDPAAPAHRRPTVWIVLCAVLALAVVGLGIWALNAQSDADDAQ